MSFGFGIGDAIAIVQLAHDAYQGAKLACGEHDDLTKEVSSLWRVLKQIEREMPKDGSANNPRRKELDEHINGAKRILRVMDEILRKYNGLGQGKISGSSLNQMYQKIKFGNGEVKDLAYIRTKLNTYTFAIVMSLQVSTSGGVSRVEAQLESVQEGNLKLRETVNWIAASMTARSNSLGDGSVWTTYENDDKAFWREFRRELNKEGFSSSTLHRNKKRIKKYLEELSNRGVFDQLEQLPEASPIIEPADKTSPLHPEGSADREIKLSSMEETQVEDLDYRKTVLGHTISSLLSDNEETISPKKAEDHNSEPATEKEPMSNSYENTLYQPNYYYSSNCSGISNVSAPPELLLEAKAESSYTEPAQHPETQPPSNSTLSFQCSVEDILDEDFIPGAHPEVYSEISPPLHAPVSQPSENIAVIDNSTTGTPNIPSSLISSSGMSAIPSDTVSANPRFVLAETSHRLSISPTKQACLNYNSVPTWCLYDNLSK